MQRQQSQIARVAVVVSGFLLAAFAFAFVAVLLTYAPEADEVPVPADHAATVTSLETRAAVLAALGDPVRGDALIETYTCAACHRAGAANGVAPSFVGLHERAAERDPALSAAAYVYQSIVQPTAYLVEGYANAMPQNYGDRLSEQEIADLVAYLLSPAAQ
jgi:cytochrome c2